MKSRAKHKKSEQELTKIKGVGDCYRKAAEMLLLNPSFLLCHGAVMGQGKIKNIKYGHAWCEMRDVVFDDSNGKFAVMQKGRYYLIGKISEVKRYSYEKALGLMLRDEHYGPWDLEGKG